jgi:quercetin dioxygenase-like cupin family protein
MKRTIFVLAAAAATFITPTAGSAHGVSVGETVTVAADEPIPNLPGKRLVSHIVDYAPGGSSAAHRHARSAFIYACLGQR